VSTVLPSGTPARAEEPTPAGGAPSEVRDRTTRGGRLAGWPTPLRVPLEVLGKTIAKAW
jgi:membrane protein